MNKKTQQIVGVLALVGIGYWAYTQYGKKKSFANLTARRRANYVAGNYDPNHLNPDGTRGATWISYGGSGSSGFWSTTVGLAQQIPQGTIINPADFRF